MPEIICNGQHEGHRDIVALEHEMPDEDTLFQLSELFKLFGDSTRIQVLCALMQSEMCVCDISALLGVSQSAISHQLRVLRTSRLVKTRRAGKSIFYSLDDDHVSSIIRLGLEHIAHTKGDSSHE